MESKEANEIKTIRESKRSAHTISQTRSGCIPYQKNRREKIFKRGETSTRTDQGTPFQSRLRLRLLVEGGR